MNRVANVQPPKKTYEFAKSDYHFHIPVSVTCAAASNRRSPRQARLSPLSSLLSLRATALYLLIAARTNDVVW
jgi:hypothetical protein